MGRPPTLSAEKIVDAAWALVEETGTLRLSDVGARLGVDATAVYRYFASRGALVSAVGARLTEPLRVPLEPTGSWRADVVARLERLDHRYRAHPFVTILVLTEAELDGPSLEIIAEGARLFRRSGAPEHEVFAALHAVEFTVLGAVMYDTVGGPAADHVRRAYHRAVGEFDVDALYPTAEELEAESVSTMWAVINATLDRLERSAAAE